MPISCTIVAHNMHRVFKGVKFFLIKRRVFLTAHYYSRLQTIPFHRQDFFMVVCTSTMASCPTFSRPSWGLSRSAINIKTAEKASA